MKVNVFTSLGTGHW